MCSIGKIKGWDMTEVHQTPLLDKIKKPSDLRKLPSKDLKQLANELRADTVRNVSFTGGHLGASLGVVELTVALHYTFNTPNDRLIWDVGHQCYPHKILTGRREKMRTIRQGGGISGFTKRTESTYDPFGTAHSSTSISAGLGMAVAAELEGNERRVIAVIGDGAMTAGMAYEAMNNAGAMDAKLIVILNDNDMSISPPVGALSAYLSRLISSKQFRSVRHYAKEISKKFPRPLEEAAQKVDEYARGMVTGGTLFEELGFYYVGPVDGHNLNHLLPVLKNLHDDKQPGPVLLHVVTEKGHGYKPAEQSSDKYHGVGKFDFATGRQHKSVPNAPVYTKVFADTLLALAEKDEKILAITAAMPSGTGLDKFADVYPNRCFDVGIAEQHAVTFAAGLAAEGFKPFAAIYSTFLQRAYDQVIHDVSIQSLPVRFALDRAGYVGADGSTHCGAFDLTYLCTLPNFVVMAPSDEAELVRMTATAASIEDQPSAIRYPRGEGVGVELPAAGETIPIGRGKIVKQGSVAAVLSLGAPLSFVLRAAEDLEAKGLSITVADARFAKPIDEELIIKLVLDHEVLISVEEGAVGGFGAQVSHFLSNKGLFDTGLKYRMMTMPDKFIEQDTPERQLVEAGLSATNLISAILEALDSRYDDFRDESAIKI